MTKFSVFYFLVLFDQSFLNLHVWGGGGGGGGLLGLGCKKKNPPKKFHMKIGFVNSINKAIYTESCYPLH